MLVAMAPLDKINALRAKHHAPPLRSSPDLANSAQQWADWLAHNGQDLCSPRNHFLVVRDRQ